MTANAKPSSWALFGVALVPLAACYAAVNLDWPMIETMLIIIAASYVLSGYLIYRGRRIGLSATVLFLWGVLFLLLVPFTNPAFVLWKFRRLGSQP